MEPGRSTLILLWFTVAFLSVQILPLAHLLPERILQDARQQQTGRCKSLLHSGRWSSDFNPGQMPRSWQPDESMLHQYHSTEVTKCLDQKHMYFIGDSSLKRLFREIVHKYGDESDLYSGSDLYEKEWPKHADMVRHMDGGILNFIWDPYLNTSTTIDTLQLTSGKHAVAISVSTGLWQARYEGLNFQEVLNVSLSQIQPRFVDVPLVALPPPCLVRKRLSNERASTMTPERLDRIVEGLQLAEREVGLEVAWAAREMTRNDLNAMDMDGLHVSRLTAQNQAELLLNRLCNNMTLHGSKAKSAMACVEDTPASGPGSGSVVVVLLFTLTIVLALRLTILIWLRKHPLQKSASGLVFIIVILLCWCTDRGSFFQKMDKPISVQHFALCAVIVLGACLACVKFTKHFQHIGLPQYDGKASKAPGHSSNEAQHEILPRVQTEEWKGWMQVVILLYHYFGMSRVLLVYQLVRLLVASYLFLTGYGHARFFWKTADFSLRRFATVLIRMNMLPCALAIVMDNPYDFYYFPGLASFWFVVVWLTFWRRPKSRKSQQSTSFALTRIMLSIFMLRAVLANEGVLDVLTSLLRDCYGPSFNVKESSFRIRLDWLIPFLGMAVAVLQAEFQSSLFEKSQIEASLKIRKAQSLLAILAFLLLCLYLKIAGLFENKYQYNYFHAYLSILPISAYVIIRNITILTRSCASSALVWVGQCSLELFVLQYHLWLAADTKGLLRLHLIDTAYFNTSQTVLGSWTWWAETIVVTAFFVWLSHSLSLATNILVKSFINDSSTLEKRIFGKHVLLCRICAASSILWFLNVLATRTTRA